MSSPAPTLLTERLSLTPLTADDAADLFTLLSDPEVTAYLDLLPLQRCEEAEELIALFAARAEDGDEVRWAIRPAAGGPLIGTCGLQEPYSSRRRAELGYVLARHHWGQRLATDAVRALLAQGFGPLRLNRIEALVYAENTASRRLLERLGFRQEGYLRQHAWENGRFWDDVVYALLAEEYVTQEAHRVDR